MRLTLHRWLLLISLSTTLAVNKPKSSLPLCPTTPMFFPQSLPMHCRMPRQADFESFPDLPQYPTMPPLPQSFYQSPSPDKMPPPVPIPIPPFPGIPGMPMPGHMGGPIGPMPVPPPGMPGPGPGMPGPMSMPMPMPIPMVGGPPHKLPVIVMPFYSQDKAFTKPSHHGKHSGNKKKPKRKPRKKKKKKLPSYDSDTEMSTDEDYSESDHYNSDSSSEHGFWKGRRNTRKKMTRRFYNQNNMNREGREKKEKNNEKKGLLTPILQYVTKDGYVIFEKQISKNEAKDWLKPKTEGNVVEERHEDSRKEKEEEQGRLKEEDFREKSFEEFFKQDAEDEQKKSENDNIKEDITKEIETTTKISKKKSRNKKAKLSAKGSQSKH